MSKEMDELRGRVIRLEIDSNYNFPRCPGCGVRHDTDLMVKVGTTHMCRTCAHVCKEEVRKRST